MGMVNWDTVRSAREAGLGVRIWTVNNPAYMLAMISPGGEKIITDKPEVLVALLREGGESSDAGLLLLMLSYWLRA